MKESLTYISYLKLIKKIMSTAHVVPKCACILFTPQIKEYTSKHTRSKKKKNNSISNTFSAKLYCKYSLFVFVNSSDTSPVYALHQSEVTAEV